MESVLECEWALALLEWQAELGADEAILDAPVDRYGEGAKAPAVLAAPAVLPATAADADPVAEAQALAAAAPDLDALRAAMAGFPHCALREGARTLVFADGLPGARVLVLGEAPGREEDLVGRPFVGAAGQMLDRMLAAIGLDRAAPDPANAVYITNVLPWRPPQNRDPSPAEISMMRPFVMRHIALAAPQILVLMGNHACDAVLGRRGILRLRGQWAEGLGLPALPMTHPSYLLRTPAAKREAWADLLSLRARLDGR